jgi:hypothetical protein
VSHTSQVQSATFGLPGAGTQLALVQSANCWSQSNLLSCALTMPLDPSNTATKDARKGDILMSISPWSEAGDVRRRWVRSSKAYRGRGSMSALSLSLTDPAATSSE